MTVIIAIEGIDGAGKTTISKFLYNEYKNVVKIKLLKEPNKNNKIGRILKEYLKERKFGIFLALLYAADRTYTYEFLKDNYDVILSDRSVVSSLAYQSIYLPESWIIEINKFVKFPDYVIYLDVDPVISIRRVKDHELFENVDYLKKVRKKYLEIIRKKSLPCKFYKINAEKKFEEVYSEVKKVFVNILKLEKLI